MEILSFDHVAFFFIKLFAFVRQKKTNKKSKELIKKTTCGLSLKIKH